MDQAAAHLLDFSKPFDIALLDQIVLIAMDGLHAQRHNANEFLVKMKEHPDMWKRADAILEQSTQITSKFFALSVLSDTINTRWKVLPTDIREGVRNYIVAKIINLSKTDELMKTNSQYLNRLNLVLVDILKQDWPANWPTFISDLVSASRTSESLCENNMKILKLLSEDVFDFSRDTMTQSKILSMKTTLKGEFTQIFNLCEFILEASTKQSLLYSTLLTLQRFITWIDYGYVFETSLIPHLINKFFNNPVFRIAALDCLVEVASLNPVEVPPVYHNTLQLMLVMFIQILSNVVPPHADLNSVYEAGSEEECLFLRRLALFLSTYLKSFLPLFEVNMTGSNNSSSGNAGLIHRDSVIGALLYLIRVSKIKDEEVFKTCLEFWSHYSKELYTYETNLKLSAGGSALNSMYNNVNSNILLDGFSRSGNSAGGLMAASKNYIYEEVLHHLRIVMIEHMAKPEEVIIVEDDNGEIIREQTKDTEVIAQYKTMKDAIVYLTHLNYEDTEDIMLKKLEHEVEHGKLPWTGLNTLCWAIGSISGAMTESDEKRFLVSVIKDLLKLCEDQKGKDNKAVVASNIMYIVGQYPRFLRAHWKFLKTVVNKLFEFMHEHHPGVQDMACDTFLKISQKCKRKFMISQQEETEYKKPFILQLVSDLRRHVADLQPHQILSFYESVATMLSDSGQAIQVHREECVLLVMDLPNTAWRNIIRSGSQNVNTLFSTEVVKEVSKILKTNICVCNAVGSLYVHQLVTIFNDLLLVYRLYSEQINAACAQQGPVAVRLVLYKAMRTVKSEILDLLTKLMEVCKDVEGGATNTLNTFLGPITAEVLYDYKTSPAPARDAKVLTLYATAISVLKGDMSSQIPQIMEAIFEPTLEMITTNMLDHPEHRIGFFKFLREANEFCFYGLFSIAPNHQKLVVDSIVWAFKHTERNISETGLEILEELLKNFLPNPQIAQSFYQAFLLNLIREVLSVMTDRLHKSGFSLQSDILMHVFHLVQNGYVTVPLFDPSQPGMSNYCDNASFLKDHVAQQLSEAFPNLTKIQITNFVLGLFDVNLDILRFKQLLRDFLIDIKEFSSEGDNNELFIEEKNAENELLRQEQLSYRQSVPGLLKPSELGDNIELE